MGRHFKARSADVNRPFKLFETPRSLHVSRVLSAIQTSVIVFSLIGFLWCLWKLPQENDEFPDGFVQCPTSSYRILNDKNITIKCKTCPECPAGQGLTPPCGSAIFPETLTMCTECTPSETFSEESGHGACKQCRRCSPRNTASPCRPEQDTQCGDCPRGYFQASWSMDSCKKCSTCCGGRSFVGLECHYLKKCKRTICPQQMATPVQTLQNIVDTLTTSAGRERHIRMAHQKIFEDDKLTVAGYSRTSEDTMPLTKNSGVKREDNGTLPKADIPTDKTAKVEEALTVRFQTDSTEPTIAETLHNGAYQPNASLSVTKARDENVDTASEQKNTQPTMPVNSSYFGSQQIIVIAIAIIIAVVLVFIAVIVTGIFWKIKPGQSQGNGCKFTCCVYYNIGSEGYLPITYDTTLQSDSEFHQDFTVSGNMVKNTFSGEDEDIDSLEGFSLEEIPLDLVELLALKLDQRCHGERLWGWQKVGIKLKIKKDILNNLENELQSSGGSPTKKLLELLGTRSTTVAELVNALKSSYVNYKDVALMVQKHYRDQRN